MKCSEACVIIRSAGERTEELSRYLVAQQVPEEKVVTIREHPLSQAVLKSFEVGLDFGLPWTICLDADVILRSGAISEMIALTAQQDATTFLVEMQTLDKFTGGQQRRGAYVYRTALLDRARHFVPSDKQTMRAGSYVTKQMRAIGYPWVEAELLVGIHEYEQYYRDIYAKRFFRARKVPYEVPFLLRRCLKQGLEDQDFWIAAWGLLEGWQDQSSVIPDAPQFQEQAHRFLKRIRVGEKKCLAKEKYKTLPDQLIAEYQPSPEYLELQAVVEQRAYAQPQQKYISWQRKLNIRARQLGLIRLFPWLGGRALCKVGDLLQRWVDTSKSGKEM